jgi:hypothetical protein
MAHKSGEKDWTSEDVVKYLTRTTKKVTTADMMERYPGMSKRSAQAYVANQTMGRYKDGKAARAKAHKRARNTDAPSKAAPAASKKAPKRASKKSSNIVIAVVGNDAEMVADTTERLAKLEL